MKKVLQINLGGVAFTIDDDAYRRLDGYMLDLGHYFSRSGNQDEIMSDIESRIAEIFLELLKARKIVEITDVEAAIRIMGTPADFGDSNSTFEQANGNSSGPWDIKTGKRLFRNTDDKIIGGVCSGLAAYFGVQEVLWVRLAFVLLTVTTGLGVIAYLVMWALVPEARSAADRLAMMGENANAQNIARMVERGIEDLSTTIKDNWKHWHSKKKRRHSDGPGAEQEPRHTGTYILAILLIPVIILGRVIRRISRRIRYRHHCRGWHAHRRQNQYV